MADQASEQDRLFVVGVDGCAAATLSASALVLVRRDP